MRGYLIWLTMATAAVWAQEASLPTGAPPETTVPAGAPLRVALEHRVRIKHVGDLVQGRLIQSVYVYDRMAIPAGSVVEGHIARIGGVPIVRRISALLSGNLTPPREVRAQFDVLVLTDGSRLPISTTLAGGTAHTARVAKPRRPGESALVGARAQLAGMNQAAILAFRTPGKMSRLKSRLYEMLPYHPQAWSAGTLFNSELQEPVAGLAASPATGSADQSGLGEPAQELSARLLTAVSSATARRGAPLEAAVIRPVFSSDHVLLIPEGSRLRGEVVEVKRARSFHRNGKLLFVFREIQLPAAAAQSVQGYLDSMEVDFDGHLALDSEGAAHVSSPRTRFIFPAMAAAAAGLSFHQDYSSQGIPDADLAGRAESGAVGLGLIGTLVAQIGPRAMASGIAIVGAGFGVYSAFIARGANVVLPKNTPISVSLKARDGAVPDQLK